MTYGTGVGSEHSYPAILSQLTGRQVINAGVSGETTQDALSRLLKALDEHQPDLLILIHGGNDFIRRLPAQQTALHIKEMIVEAQKRRIEVVARRPQTRNIAIQFGAVSTTLRFSANYQRLGDPSANLG